MQRLSLAAGPFDRFRFSHKPVAAAGGGGGTFLKNS
jgi:hypothetical protein